MNGLPSDTPKAISTRFLCRARNGHSRRQPPLFIVRVRRRSSGGAPFVAARHRARLQPRQAAVHGLGIVDPPEQIVEDDAHRRLGEAQRVAARRGELQADRTTVAVGRLAGDQAAVDERVDRRRHGWLGERQLAGELTGALGPAGDHGQQPVLGQREVGAGPFEQPRDPGQGEHVAIHVRGYRIVRDPNYSWGPRAGLASRTFTAAVTEP